MPIMPFIGVLISWLITAKKSDLLRLAGFCGVARILKLFLDFLPIGDVEADSQSIDRRVRSGHA